MNKINSLFIDKIFENLNNVNNPHKIDNGIIIASTSYKDPDYFYHWTRDSALIMKTIAKYYKETSNDKCFKQIIDYIEIENHHQNLNSLSGLGEPKFNVTKTNSLFNDIWGRPQNDGPALRGLSMCYIYTLLEDNMLYKTIIKNIIDKDLQYILTNIDYESFDLWEEVYGFHLYTACVQMKFLKVYKELFYNNNNNNNNDNDRINYINNSINKLKDRIKKHNITINSFNKNEPLNKKYDSSILLCINHIDYDLDIINIYSETFKNYIIEMCEYYKNYYSINKNNKFIFIGRYKNDKYYNGNPWIITTTALIQLLVIYCSKNIYIIENQEKIILEFISYIFKFKDLDIAEQIDKETGEQISAKNLTWNYSELYNLWELLL